MDFVVKENVFLDKLETIFEENQRSNVFDKTCLTSSEFVKYVCLFSNIPVGYIAVYPHSTFLEKEGLQGQFDVEKNAVYIWHMAIKKAFEGKGVGKVLIDEVVKKYGKGPIYSVCEEMNTPAIMLHTRVGFKPFAKFKKTFNGQTITLIMLKRNA